MLSLNQNNNSFMPGVYINTGVIISAQDLSGKPTYSDSPESIRDLAIELEIDIGKDWNKKVILKGNLKQDSSKPKSIDWGSAFVLRDFFMKTGCFRGLSEEEIKDKLRSLSQRDIPADFLIKVRGKKVYLIDYVKGVSDEGKLKYGTWNVVDTDEAKLKTAFTASLRKGYPSNYKPDVLNQNELNQSDTSPEPQTQVMAVEDDFPF